jgi:hypothetical protein
MVVPAVVGALAAAAVPAPAVPVAAVAAVAVERRHTPGDAPDPAEARLLP